MQVGAHQLVLGGNAPARHEAGVRLAARRPARGITTAPGHPRATRRRRPRSCSMTPTNDDMIISRLTGKSDGRPVAASSPGPRQPAQPRGQDA